jgi:c-di-GMP-related signal transduction protein
VPASADNEYMSDIEEAGASLGATRSICVPINGNTSGYVARQPILDRSGAVFGYELHFHQAAPSRLEGTLRDAGHGLLDTVATYGVEHFSPGSRAFLHCSSEVVVEGGWEGLPRSRTVLEFSSTSTPSPELIRACHRLQEAGFELALLNFDFTCPAGELLEFVDYVKIDANHLAGLEGDSLSRGLIGKRAIVIADNVQTHAAHRKARSLGIRYFQGLYFCNPDFIPGGEIPAQSAYQVQILRELFKDPLNLKTLCPLVKEDASLVYRVLRFANSPLCALCSPVTSIESALMILGDNTFRRIAALAIQCALSQGQTPELLNMALIRARFCAGAASLCGLDPDEQYLLGMLSMLPPMLRVPMQQILSELPLRVEIRNALAGIPGKERALLSWIEHLEENCIPGCEQIAEEYGLDAERMADLYCRALQDDTRGALSG